MLKITASTGAAIDSPADGPVPLPAQPPDLAQFLAVLPQPFPVLPALAALLALAYLSGAVRLWLTGRGWSVWRTLSFLSGCAVVVVGMGAGLEGYGYAMFSVFMFQQLTLMMAVPPLLVLGAPGTLLLRATPHRLGGQWVLRAALWGLRSALGRALIHPAVTIPLFLLSFYGLYLGGLAEAPLRSWVGHVGLEVFFLAAGVLFTVPVLSIDPLPRRQSHAARLLDVFAETALHAFFGVLVMMAAVPLVGAFRQPPAAWKLDVLYDQQVAGGLAWSYGELPSLIIMLVLLNRWFRHDSRAALAADRRADAAGDADLKAYNDYLARLQRDRSQGGAADRQ